MTLAPQDDARPRQTATSVAKALGLLDAFRDQSSTVPLTVLAARVGLPKSTAHRLLAVLEHEGFVVRQPSGYSLSRHVFELGNLIPDTRPRSLRTLAMPYLSELYETTHQTVHLAVLDGTEVLYLDKVYGHRSIETPTWVGARVAATCTALGKAILAYSDAQTLRSVLAGGLTALTPHSLTAPGMFLSALERSRAEHYATDNEESRLGLSCIAAPLIDPISGRAFAAISLSGPATNRRRMTEPLARAADALVAALSTSSNSTIKRNATR